MTTVRSSGVSHYVDVGLRGLVREGALPGPDVVASGYHVRPRVAENAFLDDPSLADLMSGVDSIEKLRRMVRAILARGVDFIKVLATEKNIPVQAHAHGDEGAMAAVKAGVRSIEHGTYLSDATLRLMKERGTYYIPTYTTVVDVAEPGGDYDVPALRIRGQHMLPRLGQVVKRAQQLGVKIATGADTGYGPNSLTRISHDAAAFVSLGMTPMEKR